MPSLADVFRTLNEMSSEGVIGDYAIGGGMAALFYAEAVATYDIDVERYSLTAAWREKWDHDV